MDILKLSEKNNFDGLPDDVVLKIFNKLWEAKWLCRCSIVSKRFSSIIPHVNNVSVKAPHFVSEQKGGSTSVFNYLVGLKDIVHLYLEERFFCEVAVAGEPSRLPVIKWKIDDIGTNVKRFTFLIATAVLKMGPPPAQIEEEDVEDEDDYDDEESEEESDEEDVFFNAINIGRDEELHRLKIALACFDDARMRLNIVFDMIGKHQMLQSITLADVMNQGKIVVSGSRIAELRDLERAKLSMPKVDGTELLFKCCHRPLLHLPKSLVMMQKITLVYIGWANPNFDQGDDFVVDDDDMLAGSFDDDEGGHFSEALIEILAHYKHGMRTGRINR